MMINPNPTERSSIDDVCRALAAPFWQPFSRDHAMPSITAVGIMTAQSNSLKKQSLSAAAHAEIVQFIRSRDAQARAAPKTADLDLSGGGPKLDLDLVGGGGGSSASVQNVDRQNVRAPGEVQEKSKFVGIVASFKVGGDSSEVVAESPKAGQTGVRRPRMRKRKSSEDMQSTSASGKESSPFKVRRVSEDETVEAAVKTVEAAVEAAAFKGNTKVKNWKRKSRRASNK